MSHHTLFLSLFGRSASVRVPACVASVAWRLPFVVGGSDGFASWER